MNYEVLKLASQIGTYTGLSASSLLTWINLHFRTAQDPDAGHRKVLTPAGKVYRALLVLSFAITIASAILQNVADAKLRKAAEEHGNQAIQQALEKQHQQYVKDLKEQFEGTNGVISQISSATTQLKAIGNSTKQIAGDTKQIAGDAVEAITGGKSHPEVTVSFNPNDLTHMGLNIGIVGTRYPESIKWDIVQLAPAGNDPMKRVFCQLQDVLGGSLSQGETGPMEPYTIPILPVSLTPNPIGVTQYRIRMEAKNGVFVQCLDVRPERNPETHQGFWNSKSVIWLRNIAIISQNDWPKIGK